MLWIMKMHNCEIFHKASPHSCLLYDTWFLKKIAILGWGNVNISIEEDFILMTTKITAVNWDIFFYLSAFNSSWYEEQFLRYKQIADEKLPLVKILENKLFRPEAIGRPVIHTHHIHMNEHTFFWMLRAQIMRICNIEMKIWGFTPSSDPFSKWLSRRKCQKKTQKFPYLNI